MKKPFFIFCVILVIGGVIALFSSSGWGFWRTKEALQIQAQIDEVQQFLDSRQKEQISADNAENPFDKNGTVRVLLLGLDSRLGQPHGHCDVIQMVEVDTKISKVTITALPRGTYSPLPPGKGTTSTDYYVSNACGLAGLPYGITQIEKILGQKADYLVVVGFSETLGILRSLNIPTTDTLQWLRRRHEYAIGEPQRAHNHSTFLKTLLTQYLSQEKTTLDLPLQYIVYKTVQTDLTFSQAKMIVETLRGMQLGVHPDRVTLAMRPAYLVQDIPYDIEHLNLKPGIDTQESIQKKLLEGLEQKKNDKEFIFWAFENNVWLQVEEALSRESWHFYFVEKYIETLSDAQKRQEILADYVLEMEHRNLPEWAQKGKQLLKKEIKP